MASQLRRVISTQRAYEPVWHSPPTFLAPCVKIPFSTSAPVYSKLRRAKKHENRDIYALRHIRARKEANLARQAILRSQREKDIGDPIRGIETPFVKSFDSSIPQDPSKDIEPAFINLEPVSQSSQSAPPSPAFAPNEKHLDHGITPSELNGSLHFSRKLTQPLPASATQDADPEADSRAEAHWKARDRSASEAVQRIVSLANGSSWHRTKANIARVIETFGRHHTDQKLKPKPRTASNSNDVAVEPRPRAGPDTGSSEVQIGILTAKIRVLNARYEGENRNDKINKRNLRLLLHRRQKLLKYMEKKERGSGRWRNLLETLGLTEATWKGQIAVQ